MSQAYLDYNASAPSPKDLVNELENLIKKGFANPSSLHSDGRQARKLINQATENFAAFVDCEPEFVYWTSGASESNSWAIHSAIELALRNKKTPRILLSSIEHESNINAAKWWQERGVEVCLLPVDQSGVLDLPYLENLLTKDSDWNLISVMHANNETGVIEPVESVVNAAKKYGIPTHVDCVQTLGKINLSVKKLGATYSTFSAHKIGGLKGVGVLTVQGEGRILSPMIHGKQQKSLRAGTENPIGVAFFGTLLKRMMAGEFTLNMDALSVMRNDFEAQVKQTIEGVVIHGERAPRLSNTSYIGFTDTDGDTLLMNLDLEGISASSGSACTSGSVDPSPVLLSMGCDKDISRSSVRFSSGRETKWQDYGTVLKVLPDIVDRIRNSKL